jgi:RND family efflux transporter MFP subunit
MTLRFVAARRWPLAGAAALALAAGCHRAEKPAEVVPAVTVSHPVEEPVIEYTELTGTVAASKTVQLMARVPGFLESVARTTVENWVSQRDQAKAQLELAKINLGYTKVAAPFTGRIGARQVDPGNVVGTNGPTLLATLEQLQPIYVNFNLNERDALHLRDLMKQYHIELGSRVGKEPVEVGLQSEKGYPHVGVLDFADNSLSTATGTIALRGVFKNEDTTLFPGLFARVRLPMGGPRPMLVIPGSAIGSDQQGDYVYVVGADDVVARRSIVRGPITEKGFAIRSGLQKDDRVIVNGILNARSGEKVAPSEATPVPAPTAAATTPAKPGR